MKNLALLLGYCFVALLFWSESKRRKLSSSALWIPGVWLFFIGARPASFWLGGGGTSGVPASRLEGSPINFVVNSGLMLASLIVLYRRNFNWSEFISKNKTLLLLYAFFLASFMWSQFPVPSIKRVFNDFGNA